MSCFRLMYTLTWRWWRRSGGLGVPGEVPAPAGEEGAAEGGAADEGGGGAVRGRGGGAQEGSEG